MDQTAVNQYILDNLAGVETTTAYGYTFFFYKSERKMPFATLGAQDDDYDRASNLNREGVFRLNIGVSRDTYQALFGPQPAAPSPEGFVATGHDFTSLDQLLPHPVYAPQSWVCVLNPSAATFEQVMPLLAEAYAIAVRRHARRPAAE